MLNCKRLRFHRRSWAQQGSRRAEAHAELQRVVREARQPRLPARRQVHAELLEVPPQHAAHQQRLAMQAPAAAAAILLLLLLLVSCGGAVCSICSTVKQSARAPH